MTVFYVNAEAYCKQDGFKIIEEVQEEVRLKPYCDCGQLDCNRSSLQPIFLRTAYKVQAEKNYSRNALKKLFGHSVRGVRVN